MIHGDEHDAESLPLALEVEPPAGMKARALARIQQHSSPPRATLTKTSIGLTVAAWGAALGVFFLEGGVRVTGRPPLLIWGTSIGTALFAGLAVWAALWRGRSNLGRPSSWVLPVVAAAPIAILSWKVFWSAHFDQGLVEWPMRPGFKCLGVSLSIALLPLLAFVALRKGSAARHPALRGLAAGLAIGCGAILLTDLWCPVAYLPHLLLGHALPVVVLGALGALLGYSVMRLRRR